MAKDFVKSIFKFYRLNQKIIFGGLGIALLLIVLMVGNTLYSNYKIQNSAETVIAEAEVVQPTLEPEIEKIDISQLDTSRATIAAQIATSGAMTTTPKIASPRPSPTTIPTPQPTPRLTPSPTPSPKISPMVSPKPSATPVAALKASPSPKASPVVTPTPTPSLKSTPAPVVKTESETKTNTDTKSYTVQPGDTLWDIAEKQVGSGYKYTEIAKLNKLKSAHHIEVGQKLQLAQKSTTADTKQDASTFIQEQTPKGGTVTETDSDTNTYTVKSGDTLWDIAGSKLGNPYRWVELYNANKTVVGNNPHLIYPGANLHLPNPPAK